MIHATAIIDKTALIGAGVEIGPYAVIGADVQVGDRTTIGAHAVIEPYTIIGSDCRVFPHAVIGGTPQSVKFKGGRTSVVISGGCIIREFVTIHRGTEEGRGVTEIGDQNFLMAYTHIAHDCLTGKGVIFANAATLAGHITIGDYATIGGLVAIHQFVKIGSYAFIGGMSAVTKDIPPYVIASGDRAKLYGLNIVGLQRHNFSAETISILKKAYRIMFRLGLTLNEAKVRIEAQLEQTPEVMRFMESITLSERGVTR
ncbi:MAG: acyl-ACP--UDP-N-acetylglucosamine O-acyltransferase [Pseudomonadota bacterium]